MTKLNTFLLIILIALFGYFIFKPKKNISVQEQSDLITQQIEKVNKMISLEGSFAEVYTMDQSQRLFFDLIEVPKQAIIIARAKTYITYDMSQLTYRMDPKNKILYITHIPDPEIIVEPNLQFYDLKANILPFTKDELNAMNERAKKLIKQEAEKSELVNQAKENLRLNLENIFIVARSQGWKVQFDNN